MLRIEPRRPCRRVVARQKNVVDVDEHARSESRKHLEEEHRGIGVLKDSMGPVIEDDVAWL